MQLTLGPALGCVLLKDKTQLAFPNLVKSRSREIGL